MFINFIVAALFPVFGIVCNIGTQIEQIRCKILLNFVDVVFASIVHFVFIAPTKPDWWPECVKHLAEHNVYYYDEAIEIFNWSKSLVMRSSSCSRNKFKLYFECKQMKQKKKEKRFLLLLLMLHETVFFFRLLVFEWSCSQSREQLLRSVLGTVGP